MKGREYYLHDVFIYEDCLLLNSIWPFCFLVAFHLSSMSPGFVVAFCSLNVSFAALTELY